MEVLKNYIKLLLIPMNFTMDNSIQDKLITIQKNIINIKNKQSLMNMNESISELKNQI